MSEKDRSSKSRGKPAKRSKPRSPNSPPREGDVYAVRLEHGGWVFAHVLLIHRTPPKYGRFIRVFQSIVDAPTWDESIAASGERFRTFFPMSSAQRDGCAMRVASVDVPEADRRWPVFKNYIDKPRSEERIWFRTRVEPAHNENLGDTVPDDLLDAPLLQVVNLIALSNLVETDWTHRTEVRDRDRRK